VNVRAARGAIVVPADEPARLHEATAKLLGAILERNAIAHDDLISILFTATEDLSSAFPAEAARRGSSSRRRAMPASSRLWASEKK